MFVATAIRLTHNEHGYGECEGATTELAFIAAKPTLELAQDAMSEWVSANVSNIASEYDLVITQLDDDGYSIATAKYGLETTIVLVIK